jgi:hypothetical protein
MTSLTAPSASSRRTPPTLRELIADLLPDLVDRFDFSRLEDAGRAFVLVEKLSRAVVDTWEQELVGRGRAEGAISTRQEDLRLLLEARFGPLPEALIAQIAAIHDADLLRDALQQVVRLRALEDLTL